MIKRLSKQQTDIWRQSIDRVTTILKSSSFCDFFYAAAASVAELMDADGAALIVKDGVSHLRYKLFFGLDKVNQESVLKFRFLASQGTVGRVLNSATYLFTPDYPNSPDSMQEFVDAGIQANLVLPVSGPNGILGALAISWLKRSPVTLTADSLTIAELFSALIGSALYRELLEEKLKHESHYDALTGLPNRRQLMLRLAEAKERAKRSQTMFAVGVIDLDRFKSINDNFGHGMGDEVLTKAASRFAASVRATDTVCRLGGDEFVVILEGINPQIELMQILQRIVDAAQIGVVTSNRATDLTASVGTAIYPIDSEEPERLLELADAAMYRSKIRGGNCFTRCREF